MTTSYRERARPTAEATDPDGFPIPDDRDQDHDPEEEDDSPKHHPAEEGATPAGDWGPEDYPF